MQRKNIIHRDLKPENILLQSDNLDNIDIRIADFGFAILEEESCTSVRCGTPGYVAPEVISGKTYNSKSDIFSAGAVLYYILSGKPLFMTNNAKDAIKQTVELNAKMTCKNLKCSSSGRKFLLRLLEKDTTLRPSAFEALQDPWFKNDILAV